MAQDPAAMPPEAEPPEGQSSDYTVEIKVSGGTFKVGVESADDEAQEEQGGGEAGPTGDDENFQDCKSVGEVIRLVRQILTSQGQMGATDAQGDADMAAGYK